MTVLPPNTGLVQGIIYQDNDGNGLFDPAVDTPLGGVAVTIIASDGTVYVAITDPSGFYSQVVPAGATLVDVQNGTVPPDLVLTTGTDGIDPTTVTVPVAAPPARTPVMSPRNRTWRASPATSGTTPTIIGSSMGPRPA